MVVPVRGLALVSGSGGTGRTTVALNLANKLAACGQKILLADLCFGWGGLNSYASNLPSFEDLIDSDGIADKVVSSTDHGFDLLTCVPPEFLDFENDDFKKLAWVLSRITSAYDLVIYDPPSGGHPLSLLASGMSDRVFIFARPDAASFGSSYCLLKSLNLEGINTRVRLIFNLTESEAHAASLKTRIDLATDRFLNFKVASGGFILRNDELMDHDFESSGISRISSNLIDNLDLAGIVTFQDETPDNSNMNTFPDRIFLRR
jgi:flagellar biosynthesis protein FlhG